MGLPSRAAVPALSARNGRAPSSARALNMAAAIGLRQMFAVQTKRIFFTRSLASVGFRTLIQRRLGIASGRDYTRSDNAITLYFLPGRYGAKSIKREAAQDQRSRRA